MSRTILIIEDDQSIRESLLDTLELADFDVLVAEHGLKGVNLAEVHLPDLIISDVMMPELDGYGVLERLRQNPVTATIPFIFLTAKTDKLDVRHGMNLGADDYLTKPFTQKELMSAIASRLQKQAMLVQQSDQQLEDLRSCITHALPHELNTPLNGIWSTAQYMQEAAHELDGDDIQELAGMICRSAERLDRLTRNFLLRTELQLIASDLEQRQQLQNQQTTVSEEVIESYASQPSARLGRQADLRFEVCQTKVKIGEFMLAKIITELVDNACKYSVKNTLIHITATANSQYCTVSVTDYGRGMTVDQIAQVGAYMQFERKLYEQQGLGLGLSLVMMIAQIHNGDVKIESIPEKYTTVRVILPIANAASFS
jgi:CheY-like chemotaxis protein/anti-sigma regulatory factor (Ser/Thr protein kinase)